MSLSEDVVRPREIHEDADVLFDLHKTDGPSNSEDDEEVIKIGEFLEVRDRETF